MNSTRSGRIHGRIAMIAPEKESLTWRSFVEILLTKNYVKQSVILIFKPKHENISWKRLAGA